MCSVLGADDKISSPYSNKKKTKNKDKQMKDGVAWSTSRWVTQAVDPLPTSFTADRWGGHGSRFAEGHKNISSGVHWSQWQQKARVTGSCEAHAKYTSNSSPRPGLLFFIIIILLLFAGQLVMVRLHWAPGYTTSSVLPTRSTTHTTLAGLKTWNYSNSSRLEPTFRSPHA